jgi:hypothetical protein
LQLSFKRFWRRKAARKMLFKLTTGLLSVDIEFCSYNPKDGKCKSNLSIAAIAIGVGVAGFILIIFVLLAFCCYRRMKNQV